MKYKLFLFLSIAMLSIAKADLPNDFKISKALFSLTDSFAVESDSGAIGEVKAEIFSLTKTFTFTDNNGEEMAKAVESFLSWGNESKIYDRTNRLLGTVKEEVFSSFLGSSYNTYKIKKAADKKIASSEKTSLFGTEITIYNENGAEIAKLSRENFSARDTWNVHIDAGTIDPRLILFIAAYKSSKG